MRRAALLALTLLAVPVVQAAERIVSVNGSLTEIVYALEAESRLVGVDTTSLYPSEARELPGVGYQRSLSAEGILALAPDRVLATPDAGPPAVLEQLRGAGVRLAIIDAEPSIVGVIAKVRAVARLLGLEARGERLIETIELDAVELAAYRDRHNELLLGEAEALHLGVVIDRASHWVYLELRPDKSARTAERFLRHLLARAPFRITRILTDNDKAFTDRFAATGERRPTGKHAFDRLVST